MTDAGAAGRIAHGGNLAEARARFPDAPSPFIDLSTGINPVPYPFAPPPPDAFTRLPEPGALAALQAAAARAYGVADPAMVVAAPGTQILISLLPRLFPQATVAVLGPTYAEHAASWVAVGTRVSATESFDGLGAGAAVLCNPNNPDGRRIGPTRLRARAAEGALLVVDEAFADLEGPATSLAPHIADPGTIVLRSFGKTFGLAGLRLGFALAMPDTAALIRDAIGPWAVSGPAIDIACKAFADTAWLAQTVRRLDADLARLDALLVAARCRVIGGTRLFRLVETEDTDLFDRLGRAGIFVRAFPDCPSRFRFGIPGPSDWDRVAAALR